MANSKKAFFLISLFIFLFFGSETFAAACNKPPDWNTAGICALQIDYEDYTGGSNLDGCYYAIESGSSPTCPSNGTWDTACDCSGLASITCPVDVPIGSGGGCDTNGAGACKICSKAVDTAGNVGYGEQVLNIDFEAPVTSIQCDGTDCVSGWYNSETGIDITLSCLDSDSGCDEIYYCFDTSNNCSPSTLYTGVLNLNAEGINYIRYYSIDIAGNNEAVKSQTIKLDKNDLSGTLTISPTTVQIGSLFTVSVDSQDSLSGVNYIYLYREGSQVASYSDCNGSSSCSYSWDRTEPAEGTYYYQALIYDVAGNFVFTPPEYVTVIPLDNTPPALVSWVPENRTCTNANTDISVTVQYADADTGLAETRYCWTTSASCSPATLFAAPDGGTTTQSATGSWTLCVKATDQAVPANTVTECKGTYVVDKIPPATPTFNPSSRTWSNQDATVTVTYTDNICNIDYTRHCWTESASCEPGTTAASTFTNGAAITQTNPGDWTLCTRARDGAGNWKDPECSGPYQIDKQGPTVGAISPTACQVGVATNFSAQVSDNIEVADSGCWLYVDGANVGSMDSALPCLDCTVSRSHTFAATGEYSLYALCEDTAGNLGAGPPVTVTVTEYAPLICDIDVPGSGTVNQWIEINVSGSQGLITGVRFASDNNLNGTSDGNWDPPSPNYYNWSTSSGNWNGNSKTMKWSFANQGEYEVWAEITDGEHISQCYEKTLILQCYPGQTTICAPQGCSHTIICQLDGTWPACPEDECTRFTEDDSSCPLCPEDRCIGLDWFDYPYYDTTNRSHGDCDNECQCDIGTGTGQPCEPSIDIGSENCSDPDNENCSNNIDDNGDGLIDCQDPDCPSIITCNTCEHPECNAFGNYDWTCQSDPAGTDCGDCRECDGSSNCLYLCSGNESSCECLYDTCTDCSNYYDGSCGYQGLCHCGPLEKPTWGCLSGQCSCVCNFDSSCQDEPPDDYPDDYPEVIIDPPSQEGDPGDEVSYEVTIINPNDEEETYNLTPSVPSDWSYSIDETTVTISPGGSENVELRVTPPADVSSGEYEISVTAQNEKSGTGYAEYVIPNQPPDKPSPVGGGETWNNCSYEVSIPTFHWTYNDPENDPQTYTEIIVYGETTLNETISCSSSPCESYTPSINWIKNNLNWGQTYSWQVRVRDNQNNWSEWSDPNSFTMPLHAYPSVDFLYLPEKPDTEDIVNFTDDTTFYGGASGSSWTWDFGDDNIGFGETTQHSYTDPGTYNVILEACDTNSYCCPGSRNITISVPLPGWEEISPF